MPRIFYSLLWLLVVPFALLRLCWKSRHQPEYLHHIPERLGSAPISISRAPCIWLHAVSVGETRAAQPIIKALLAQYPDHQILLTHMTPTGRATGKALFGDEARVRQSYLPYDHPWFVRRFLRRTLPVLGLMMETEVWPTLVYEVCRMGVPLLLINARLSEKSARGYAKLGKLTRQAFSGFTHIAAQTEEDAVRLRHLGARFCTVTGNVKFDVEIAKAQRERGQNFRTRFTGRPILLAASTREGEEQMLLDAFIRHATPETLLVIVPRHPQRFEAVAQLVAQRGLIFARRSEDGYVMPHTRVWIGDSMGEMVAYFSMADVAIIGGSWVKLGGQNLIEACAVGVPVIVGPHTFNFAQASNQAIDAGAALRCLDVDDAIKTANTLLDDPLHRQVMREAGLRFFAAHQGCTQKTMSIVVQNLSSSEDSSLRL